LGLWVDCGQLVALLHQSGRCSKKEKKTLKLFYDFIVNTKQQKNIAAVAFLKVKKKEPC
jgi:hypothetical protein